MAKRLGVHASTICRELQRGDTGTLKIGYMGHVGEGYRRKSNKLRGRKGNSNKRSEELAAGLKAAMTVSPIGAISARK